MFKHKEKGQSVIELTFFLIILLILIAGIVEVGAILQTKLTVVNSAREGARFGTQSQSDTDVTMVTDAAASNVINYSSDNADIWVIRAKTDESGGIGDDCLPVNERESADTYWCVAHTLGEGPDVPEFVTKEDIQTTLAGVTDTEVVGVAVTYDHQSIVGLPYAVGGGGMPVTSFTVMKVERTNQMAGCLTWPIVVYKDTVNWPDGFEKGHPLPDIYDGPGGTMGWVRWNREQGGGSAQALLDRLTNPSSIGQFTNAADEDDHHLDVGDWVLSDSGVVNANDVRQVLVEGKRVRILVYDRVGGLYPTDEDPGTCPGQSANCSYEIIGFVTVTLKDLDDDGQVFEVDGPNKRIEAEFVSFDYNC